MPETAAVLIRPAAARHVYPSTPASRLRRRDYMRARRAAARAEELRRLDGFSFEAICDAVGLNPSPGSSLNPLLWCDVTRPYEGLGLRRIRVDNAQFYVTNDHLFAKASS